MARSQSCEREREGKLRWGRVWLVCPGRGQTFAVSKSEREGKTCENLPPGSGQMPPHTIPLSPAMWFGEQDDRLIGLGCLGQAAFIWGVSAGQGPRWCVLSEPEQLRTCPPTPHWAALGRQGRGTEGLLCGWEDLGLRMARALGT